MEERRKKIVVNTDFQYRTAKLTLSVAIFAMNILLIVGVLVPELVKFQLVITQLGAFIIAGVECLLFAIVWYAAIRYSHRVAGPMYAFTRALEKVENGDLTAQVALRKTDEFKEFADSINRAVLATKYRLKSLRDALDAASACSDVQEAQRIIADLKSKAEEFKIEATVGNETQ